MMKIKYYLQILFCLMMLVIPSQYVYGQSSGGHVVRQECSVCGKLIKNCRYKGSHPKCSTCGKLKEDCPYKGKHPKCSTCGKLKEDCPYKSSHPKCSTCGKLKEDCPFKGNHPKPLPTTGSLSITSTPSDASIKINGKYIGITPLILDSQNPGTYKITFSAEGYEHVTQSITISAGKTTTCNVTLKKKQVSQPVVQQPTNTTSTVPPTSSSYQTFTVGKVSFNMIRVEGQGMTFYIGETEVTQALWEAVMLSNPSSFKGANHPVENVSWNDCKEFISRLNSATGKVFRLPMEKEWEYAAKGGNKSHGYEYSGSNEINNVAWYEGNACNGIASSSPDYGPHDVKTKLANELGLYDMCGNVWEWCEDLYSSKGSSRVNRGGGWSYFAKDCRVSNRNYFMPDYRSNRLGLRLALSLDIK